MTQLSEVLSEQNPWWRGESLPPYKDRELLASLQKYLPLRPAVALTGLRRVGKTTLLWKIAEDAIAGGLDPDRVVYFSFDDHRDATLRDVVRAYEEATGHALGDARTLVLLDEIQKVDRWDEQLKAIYDRPGRRVKFVISGSESLFIRARSRATLAGRLFEFRVDPLNFREYLRFTGQAFDPPGVHESALRRALPAFVRTLGFPELVGVDDAGVVRKYVQEGIVEKVIYRDLAGLFRLRDVTTLEALIRLLMAEPGHMLDLAATAGELGITRQTLSAYLGYLEKSFLMLKLYNFSTGRRKVERKLKKYYPAVVDTDLLYRRDTEARGRVLEWLVVTQLRAEYFWRDAAKNEVDIVLGDRVPEPIEVKSSHVDLSGLQAFLRRSKALRATLVTWDRAEEPIPVEGRRVSVTPAHRFLLEHPRPEERG